MERYFKRTLVVDYGKGDEKKKESLIEPDPIDLSVLLACVACLSFIRSSMCLCGAGFTMAVC